MADRAVAETVRQLLDRADVSGDLLVTGDAVASWEGGVLDALLDMGVLEAATNQRGVVCTGCEESCWVVPVSREVRGERRPMHFCEVREDISWVQLEPERMRSWSLSLRGLAGAVAEALGFVEVEERDDGRGWLLGWSSAGRVFLAAVGDVEGLVDQAEDGDGLVVVGPRSAPSGWPGGSMISLMDGLRVEGGRLALAAAAQRKLGVSGGRPSLRRFPMPADLGWERLVIRVLDDEHVELQAGRTSARRSYVEMGMADTRKVPSEPKRAWTLLLLFARERGELGWGDQGAAGWVKAQMKHLRQHLRDVTGLQGNPFHTYKATGKWVAKFTITDLRGPAR